MQMGRHRGYGSGNTVDGYAQMLGSCLQVTLTACRLCAPCTHRTVLGIPTFPTRCYLSPRDTHTWLPPPRLLGLLLSSSNPGESGLIRELGSYLAMPEQVIHSSPMCVALRQCCLNWLNTTCFVSMDPGENVVNVPDPNAWIGGRGSRYVI